ncbi:MAG TPA: MinD/ParA family protein [Aggregatilineales bacterium]|nr:MinD/ParA family protein [Aggregatilineales bacterium]
MSKIISIHSFRGGTGKSNTSANISALMAMQGLRVGVVDTDIQSPGIHILFKLDDDRIKYTLNDYLWGKCEITDAVYDVTGNVGGNIKGQIFLVPSSIRTGEIARVIKEGYDVGILNDGFHNLVEKMNLDALVIDTHPGLNEETLLSIAISDSLVIILRPDSQDYQGTSVTVEVARKLDVANIFLIINKAPSVLNFGELKQRVEKAYDCPVAAVLPHSDDMMILAGEGVFAGRFPDHEITKTLKGVADLLMRS